MQGNRSQSRSNWKQAVRKDNPVESRIFGVNRELPNKFSPARFNNNQPTARSLIKHKSNNYSHDQFAIAAILSESRERSSSREPRLERKPTEKALGVADGDAESIDKPRLQSFKSIDIEMKRLSFKPSNKDEDLDIVRELKLEFLRFKERVMKELRKQEEDLKAAIQQIYDRVGSLQNCIESPIQFRSSPVCLKPTALTISSASFDGLQSPISKYLEALNRQAPDTISEGKNYGKTQAATIIQQSFTPQIKQRISKFEELLNNLKKDLNTQLPIDSPSTANLDLNDT